jgi:DNA-binding beta-propeller fold protein YncE
MSFALSRKSFSNLYFYSNVLFFLSISIVAICFSITFFSNTVLAESQQYIFIKKWRSRCDNQGNGSCIHKNDGQFSDPTGLAIDSSDNVYVIDYFNHRVEKFKDDSTFITKWGSFGTKEGQLNYATGIAVDKDGFVYVADSDVNSGHPGNIDRIQKFTSDGTFVTKWGSPGTGDWQFQSISELAVDKDGFVYATDFFNHRIQKFTKRWYLCNKMGLTWYWRWTIC